MCVYGVIKNRFVMFFLFNDIWQLKDIVKYFSMKIPMQLGNTLISMIIRKRNFLQKNWNHHLTNIYFSATHPDTNEKNLDDDLDENILDTSGFELVLPSGKVVGHRVLVRYYRQSLANRNNERSVELVNRLKDKYRALGWSGPGTTGEVYHRKIRDLKYMQQWKNKQSMRLGVRNNMHQHHFRQQVNF